MQERAYLQAAAGRRVSRALVDQHGDPWPRSGRGNPPRPASFPQP